MKTIYRILILLQTAIITPYGLSAQQSKNDTSGDLPLTLNQVWDKAAIFNKSLQMKQIGVESSVERIKDARNERLPEIIAEGEYARISNMPVYSNGLFHTPEQFEVLHSTYTVGAEAYLNIYNGNKVNIEIDARKTENRIATEQKKLTLSEVKLRAAAYYLDMQRTIIFKDLFIEYIYLRH